MAERITRTDIVVVAVIIALGAMQVCLVRRGDAFLGGDTTYVELAESIVKSGPYGFDNTPETLLPPGLPSFLALLCVSVGCGHATDTRAMAIFATLGFLFSYALIRRLGGRAVAAAACLIPMSSPEIFSLTTNEVMSDAPYFAALSLALWLAVDLDDPRSARSPAIRSGLLAATVAIGLLLRSAAIAMLVGAAAWLGATWWMDRGSTRRRLLALAPALLLGASIQGAWMVWAGSHEVSEWPLGGYPNSYLSQVLIVSGNQPELGQASLGDLARRVDQNLLAYTAAGVQVLTRHWILPDWGSPAISAPLFLLLVGLGGSLIRRGGALHDWVFLVSAAMLMLWPWNLELRFILPIVPLACWYVWRGAQELGRRARLQPRALGWGVVAASALLAAIAGGSAVRMGTLQPLASLCFWIGLGAAALWRIHAGRLPLRTDFASRGLRPSAAAASMSLLVGGLVALGAAEQLAVGRHNLAFEPERSGAYADVEAAQWLRQHTPSDAVLMARQVDVVYRYSGRRVVWFPPLSAPGVLMAGIQRHGVRWIVVTERDSSYWLPRESDVFQRLLAAYPDALRLEASGPKWRVFAVDAVEQPRALARGDVAAGPSRDPR